MSPAPTHPTDPGASADPPGGESARPSTGEFIDGYELIEVLGEGGMGVVHLAEQHGPVRRRVALKVIRLGLDSKQVLARFDTERRALAIMDHPCIAKVFDAGATSSGQPYFVMEYVDGEPITTYCDDHRLTIDERLALFKRVCSGVQHAHRKGVMHRDLKPDNVLVTRQDGNATPKVIDFGLAKVLDHGEGTATLLTEPGQFMGTPEYMSPEQTGLEGTDVDVRSDVYSLGVLLYELVTGELPFSSSRLRSAGWAEMYRIIQEVEPAKPSHRLRGKTVVTERVADRRRTTIRSLARKVRGDLDWITMRALEKDRRRRYDSVSELVAELERFEESLPVHAGPAGLGYRMRKLLRRRAKPMTVGGLAAIVVVPAIARGVARVLVGNAPRGGAREADPSLAIDEAFADRFSSFDVEWLTRSKLPATERFELCWSKVRFPTEVDPVTLEQALLSFQRMLERDPLVPRYRIAVGLSQYRLERLEEAAATLESVHLVEDDRVDPAGLAALAMTLHRLGRITEAKLQLDRLERVMKDPWVAWGENVSFLEEARAVCGDP